VLALELLCRRRRGEHRVQGGEVEDALAVQVVCWRSSRCAAAGVTSTASRAAMMLANFMAALA
jgi:hypothetical protein